MAATSRRVVITGMGVVSPIGLNAAAFWDSLTAGKGGLGPIEHLDGSALPTRVLGRVKNFDAKGFIDKEHRKSLRIMARTIQLAVAAAQMAMAESVPDRQALDSARFGVEFGCGMIASELEDLAYAAQASTSNATAPVSIRKWGAEGVPAIPPLWMLKYLPNMPACHVSIIHDAQGPSNSITASDVASLLALGEATRILQRGQADFFLVGGCDSRTNPLSLVRQNLFQPLTRRNDNPVGALRPFDRHRDGTVLGEGAAVLAVEALEHAQGRGASILAEVVGFGAAFDRNRDGSGLARAIRAALAHAKVQPDEIDHVNAHGLGTVDHDVWEARALADVFQGGRRKVPIFAAKGYIGSLASAAGLVELSASLLALKHGMLPRTLNYETPDPACPIPVNAELRRVETPYALKLGFTDLGQAAAVVIRRWE